MSIVVIAAYHCEVAGKPIRSVDYQIRYFGSDSLDEIAARLRNEVPQAYQNCGQQEVRWLFDDTVAAVPVESDPTVEDGKNVSGDLIGKSRVIPELAAPPNRRASRPRPVRSSRKHAGC